MKTNPFTPVLAAFAALLLFVAGCNTAPKKQEVTSTSAQVVSANTDKYADTFDLVAMKKLIEEKNNQFTKAHITGDTASLNSIFTKDAKVFAPNSEPVVGRTAIAALNTEYVNYGIKEFREETTALYGDENYIIDEGNYFMRYGKANTVEKGKYLNIWKRENGDWKVSSNIWNTNTPAPEAK